MADAQAGGAHVPTHSVPPPHGVAPAQQGLPPHGGAQPMAEELGKHQASINVVGGAVN